MRKCISIVTGATGGIGREFVKLLLNENVDEIWSVARNIEKLNDLREEFGEKIIPISCDLSKKQSFELLNNMLQEQNPTIICLVNNAGGGRMGAYNEFSQAEIEAHITTHCTEMQFYVIYAFHICKRAVIL
jgi:short-subunit dehydrogenase